MLVQSCRDGVSAFLLADLAAGIDHLSAIVRWNRSPLQCLSSSNEGSYLGCEGSLLLRQLGVNIAGDVSA